MYLCYVESLSRFRLKFFKFIFKFYSNFTLTAIPSESDGACTEGAAVSSKREETADPKEGGHGEDPMTEAATGANGGEVPEEEEEDKDDPEAQVIIA